MECFFQSKSSSRGSSFMFTNTIAHSLLSKGFTHISKLSSLVKRKACIPSLSWLTAITSLLVSVFIVSLLAERTSLPRISGEANILHIAKWVLSSAAVIPFPTSIISKSFQCPGPDALRISFRIFIIFQTPQDDHEPCPTSQSQQLMMSPVTLHKCPTFSPHFHGSLSPHSQILNTTGFPALVNASPLGICASSSFNFPVLHQSYFR